MKQVFQRAERPPQPFALSASCRGDLDTWDCGVAVPEWGEGSRGFSAGALHEVQGCAQKPGFGEQHIGSVLENQSAAQLCHVP